MPAIEAPVTNPSTGFRLSRSMSPFSAVMIQWREEPWPCVLVPQGQGLNDCSQAYRPPPSWSPSWPPSWSRETLTS